MYKVGLVTSSNMEILPYYILFLKYLPFHSQINFTKPKNFEKDKQ